MNNKEIFKSVIIVFIILIGYYCQDLFAYSIDDIPDYNGDYYIY